MTPRPKTDQTQPETSSDAELIQHITFMSRLWVWCERDVIELAKAQPLAIDRDTKVAEINGFPGSLCDLVSGGSWGFTLRRQIRHDDSADVRQNKDHRGEKKQEWGFVSKASEGARKKRETRMGEGQQQLLAGV